MRLVYSANRLWNCIYRLIAHAAHRPSWTAQQGCEWMSRQWELTEGWYRVVNRPLLKGGSTIAGCGCRDHLVVSARGAWSKTHQGWCVAAHNRCHRSEVLMAVVSSYSSPDESHMPLQRLLSCATRTGHQHDSLLSNIDCQVHGKPGDRTRLRGCTCHQDNWQLPIRKKVSGGDVT